MVADCSTLLVQSYVCLSIQLCRGRASSIVSQFRPSYVSVSSSLPLSDSLSLSHSTWLYTGGNIINHRDLSCCSLLIQRHKCNISLCHLKKQALQHYQCPPRNPVEAILVLGKTSQKKRKKVFYETFHIPTHVLVVLFSFFLVTHLSYSDWYGDSVPSSLLSANSCCRANKQQCTCDGCVACNPRPVTKSQMER